MLHMSTDMIWQTKSIDSADTERLGEILGRALNDKEIIELRSDLGGGKTTFVKGLARGLGSKDNVNSPTFTLNRVYKGRGKHKVHHYDFYRLSDAGIMSEELAESLSDPNITTVVEWSDIVQDILPEERLTIEFKPVEDNPDQRLITIHYPESRQNLIKTLETKWMELRP
jgi:tRNA threonylcarbamoyladenosine biosynthesis protein TsaE